MKVDLLNLTMEEMGIYVSDLGEKPFRGKQVFQWVQRGAESFDEMTNLSKELRKKLAEHAVIGRLELLDVQEDRTDGTRKFLFGVGEPYLDGSTAGRMDEKERAAGGTDEGEPDLDGNTAGGTDVGENVGSGADESDRTVGGTDESVAGGADKGARAAGRPGLAIESVFMKYSYGNTLCVSTQIGCRMGCKFCASALGGFVRNLTAGEMLGQVLAAERQTGETISHIVLMGMGEPFDNYENVSRFLRIMHEPAGRNMSWRHMTVSTSGIIPGMQRFAGEFPQVNLAISLHRIDDAGRSEIMPINRRYPVKELLAAAREISERTGRRITFEYALIRGVNDRKEDLTSLCGKLRGMLCHVNLIPLNEVAETGLAGSSRQRAREIAEQLEQAGIPATVRRELGSEIDGACGQLRLRRGKSTGS